MNALRTLHAVLVRGGLVIDTQPVSAHPLVVAESGELGTLDMREWARTIEEIDGRLKATTRAGLFAVQAQRTFVVTDSFDDGAEMLAAVRSWQGTDIPPALERRAGGEDGAVHVHQDIRLRLLRAL